MESMAIIIVALIGIGGNLIQYLLHKKSNDMESLIKQVDLLSKLQKEQSIAYQNASKLQENKIGGLEKKVKEQDGQIKEQNNKIEDLQRLINRLIGNGCHLDDCPNRSPYTVEDLS